MRHPVEVAGRMRDVVPDEFKPKFDKLISDMGYKAPEQVRDCWFMLSELCNVLLLEGEPWKKEMVGILIEKEG